MERKRLYCPFLSYAHAASILASIRLVLPVGGLGLGFRVRV